MKKIIFLIFLIIPSLAMSSETAKYKVLKTISDNIEIRQYKKLVLANISTKDGSENKNFRSLFKYISGENKDSQEISMTTPVFKESINNKESMSFVMPDDFSESNTPKPNNENIKIQISKNSKFIAIRFSGRAVDKNFSKYQKILEDVIQKNGIRADLANPIKAYYNAPWTIPFFKRNEVLFKLI